MTNLNASILKIVEPSAISQELFGPLLDSIDVFGRHRDSIAATVRGSFPLEWMPIFGGDPQGYSRRLIASRQARERAERAQRRLAP